MFNQFNPRSMAMGAVKRLLAPAVESAVTAAMVPADESTSLTESPSMSRSRDRILANLDDMYSEAFEAAKQSGDDAQMRTLDFAYRREQLYFEILLDIRDGMGKR